MKKAVFFDMDGVILESMSFHVRAWLEALGEKGVSVPEELIYLHEGAIEPKTAMSIFEENGLPMDEYGFKCLFRRQMEIFTASYQPMVRPYPGVEGIIERLSDKNVKMALVTSSHMEIVDKILPAKILNLMSYIVTGDNGIRRKPFPDPYISAMQGLGFSVDSCLVVENAPAGIAAAKAASIKCVAITTTLKQEHLSRADAVLSSHGELEGYLMNWIKQ